MNEFDRYLETNLRRMLDPVVSSRVPVRRARPKSAPRPFLAIEAPRLEMAAETIPVGEPAVIVIPIHAGQPLL